MTIYFDMDGTLFDTYCQPNWLSRLRAYDPTVYAHAPAKVDFKRLNALLRLVRARGYDIGIITWLSKESTPAFTLQSSLAKREAIRRNRMTVNRFLAVPYGTKKHSLCKGAEKAILFDDCAEIREAWKTKKRRKAFSENEIFDVLEKIVKGEEV